MNVVSESKRVWWSWGLLACVGLIGCSGTDAAMRVPAASGDAGASGAGASDAESGGAADSSSSGAAGQGASGGARPAGSGPLSYPGCDHVIVDSLDVYSSDGSSPRAVAAWNGQLYLLTGDGKFQTVRVTDGATLKEVARVPDDDDQIDLTPSTLLVDSNGFFFDGYQGGHKRLIGVPLAGGDGIRIADLSDSKEALGSWFVSDENALYFVADGDGSRVLQSTPRKVAEARSPVVITDYTAFYEGLTSLGRVGSSVFTVAGGASDFAVREFPVLPADPPAHERIAVFTLKDCSTFAIPPRVVSGDDALYVGCNSDGNQQSYIFRLLPAAQWPEGEESEAEVALEPLAASAHLDEDTFIAVGKNVYFRDTDSNDADHVFRVPATAGKPTSVLDTHVVHHMASDGKTLFVEGSCGIQAIPL